MQATFLLADSALYATNVDKPRIDRHYHGYAGNEQLGMDKGCKSTSILLKV